MQILQINDLNFDTNSTVEINHTCIALSDFVNVPRPKKFYVHPG